MAKKLSQTPGVRPLIALKRDLGKAISCSSRMLVT